MTKVLVIDDEPQIRRALRAGLERHGYAVLLAETGEQGLDLAALHAPELVILDLAMPRMDGLEVCRQMRARSKTPIIVLSVRDEERDKIAALELGADDYMTKPFGVGELVARMRAVLRRAQGQGEEGREPARLTCGELRIDFVHRKVSRGDQELRLTPIEYDLLRQLALNPDVVMTHRLLLTRVWGAEYAEDTHTLRVHIANLRGKIEPDADRPRYIQTELRIGYRFRSET